MAQTAAAASTQTAANITIVPTWTASTTPPPTDTPTLTPSPTATFIFRLTPLTPTRKPTATDSNLTGGLACALLSQSPADGSQYSPKQNFTAAWNIKNTGDVPWDTSAVDFRYFSGSKMFTGAAAYDLPDAVAVNDDVTLSVPMVAPKNSGSFRTVWTLQRGKNDFCHVDVRIVVK